MKIQGIEIILDGALPTDELVGYVERAKEKHGDRIVQMSVKVDGEFVELDYTIQPIKFERIRRITGYLVGTTDRWNNAKRAEERDRVKHQEDELQSDVPDYLNPHRMVGGCSRAT